MMEPLDVFEVGLPTFAVLARFRVIADSYDAAAREVMARLTAAEAPFHEVNPERQEEDGSWLVLVRFVLVSVDGHTAVAGLHETLTGAAMLPDEVWVDRAL